MIIIGVVAAGIAIASTWDNSQSHDTLWVKYIKGKNVNEVLFYDDIRMSTYKGIRTDSLAAATLDGQITIVDNVLINGKNLGVGGRVTGTSGVRINDPSISRPSCSSANAGLFWYNNPGLSFCSQSTPTSGTYYWYVIDMHFP